MKRQNNELSGSDTFGFCFPLGLWAGPAWSLAANDPFGSKPTKEQQSLTCAVRQGKLDDVRRQLGQGVTPHQQAIAEGPPATAPNVGGTDFNQAQTGIVQLDDADHQRIYTDGHEQGDSGTPAISNG